MKPSPNLVTTDLSGRMFILSKPSSEHLHENMRDLRSVGIDLMVSMLEQKEAAALGLQNEGDACRQYQIGFMQFEIQDLGLPDVKLFTSLIGEITNKLRSGQHVAVHCRAGIGRSGMVACCVLIRLGFTSEDAIKHVTKARGVAIPDTDEQIAFIHQFSAAH